ncbi:hypothetical protein LK12_18115 [Novosphingobium malaysiense]|uniref:TonB-dependent receptor n=2 Tax=Novosphingobium malaysiense TaxID=1348853 RepID=A0A0B1ZH41_9SPHN|nr:hypothetical protein LK12_18115 [Novosphingobium malaysiense]
MSKIGAATLLRQGRCSSLIALAAGFLAATPALAQEVSPQSSEGPKVSSGDIIVTARRVEERLQDVPIALTAISGDDFSKLNIQGATDLQNHTSNLYIRADSLGGNLQPSFVLRGQVQTLTTDENVALYVADVPQSTRSLSGSMYDLAQIQVLKGPQGTLFGKNSNSGAIVVTPNRPTYEFGGWVEGQYGDYDFYQLTGMLNAPIIQEKVALRLAGRVTRQDGTVKNTLPGYADWDNQRYESFRASLLIEPAYGISNLTVFDYLHRREVPTPFVTLASGTSALAFVFDQVVPQQEALGPFARPGVTGLNARGPDGGYITNALYAKVWGVSNTTTFDVSDAITIKNIFGYRREKASSALDLSGAHGYTIYAPDPVLVSLNNTVVSHDLTAKSDELQVIANLFGGKLNLIAGGFYSDSDDPTRTWSDLQIGYELPGRPGIDDDIQYYKSRALFAEGTVDLSSLVDGLKFTSGARYTWDKRSIDKSYFVASRSNYSLPNALPLDAQYPAMGECSLIDPNTFGYLPGVDPATCRYTVSDKYHGFTYNETLAWQATRGLNLYASYKKGYKSGGMNQYAARTDPDLTSYKPETLKVWEIGAKAEGYFTNGRWNFNAAYFNGRYKNLQTQAIPDFSADFGLPPQSQIILTIINSVKAKMQGIELDGGVTVGNLSVNGAFSWLDQKYTAGAIPSNATEFRNGTGYDLAGTTYPGAPKYTASGTATYRMSWIPESAGDVALTGSVSHHSRAPGSDAPGASVSFVPAYTIFDLNLAWNNFMRLPVDLGFWMKNVTDEAYETTCLDNRESLGYRSCQFGRQRTFGFSLKYRFGAEAY